MAILAVESGMLRRGVARCRLDLHFRRENRGSKADKDAESCEKPCLARYLVRSDPKEFAPLVNLSAARVCV